VAASNCLRRTWRMFTLSVDRIRRAVLTPNAGLQPPPTSEATREPQARLAAVGCKAGLGVISSPQLALGASSTMLGASRD
jgi:hypothetical protein